MTPDPAAVERLRAKDLWIKLILGASKVGSPRLIDNEKEAIRTIEQFLATHYVEKSAVAEKDREVERLKQDIEIHHTQATEASNNYMGMEILLRQVMGALEICYESFTYDPSTSANEAVYKRMKELLSLPALQPYKEEEKA